MLRTAEARARNLTELGGAAGLPSAAPETTWLPAVGGGGGGGAPCRAGRPPPTWYRRAHHADRSYRNTKRGSGSTTAIRGDTFARPPSQPHERYACSCCSCSSHGFRRSSGRPSSPRGAASDGTSWRRERRAVAREPCWSDGMKTGMPVLYENPREVGRLQRNPGRVRAGRHSDRRDFGTARPSLHPPKGST